MRLQAWHDRGAPLRVPGTASTRIWREGSGPTVVCLHGVPTSAYLYRKVLPELAARGLEGVALDFPGVGFAERPEDFNYRWSGLAAWLERALMAAGIERLHLVVHDIGGPVGFDLIRRVPDRILSLTVLDTMARPTRFSKSWVMRPFSVPVLGRLWVAVLDSPLIFPLFRWKGAYGGTYGEIRTYGRLVAGEDGGRAFRRIMAGFETDRGFEDRTLAALGARTFPAQVVWGEDDPELRLEDKGAEARDVLGLEPPVHAVRGKHFVPEDSPAEIAARIALLVETGTDV